MVASSWNEPLIDEVCCRVPSGLRSYAACATYLLACASVQPLAVASLNVCAITESGSMGGRKKTGTAVQAIPNQLASEPLQRRGRMV